MKYLFVHQNFPGQFLHFLRHLVAQGGNEIVFITEPNQNFIPGVRKVPHLKPVSPTEATHFYVREMDMAMRRADAVAGVARNLRELGFSPDVVIGHHGWGELLRLQDIWPGVPMIGYFEFFYNERGQDVGFDPEFPDPPEDGGRIRSKNLINLLALNGGGLGQTPTEWQLSTYPDWARPRISLLREGVDLALCAPDPAFRKGNVLLGDWDIGPKEKLVTYVSRDLEPYRGFHIMMRALPKILDSRKDVRVILVGGDGISYGVAPFGSNWKTVMLREMAGKIDLSRVMFPGRIPYTMFTAMLKRSDAHVYLTYPFVASWSLREAMATGCAVVGSDTQPVREFVQHGATGLLTPCLDPARLADSVLEVLENKPLNRQIRQGAREWAEANLAMPGYLAAYDHLVEQATGRASAPPAPTAARDSNKRSVRHVSSAPVARPAEPARAPGPRKPSRSREPVSAR